MACDAFWKHDGVSAFPLISAALSPAYCYGQDTPKVNGIKTIVSETVVASKVASKAAQKAALKTQESSDEESDEDDSSEEEEEDEKPPAKPVRCRVLGCDGILPAAYKIRTFSQRDA